MIRRLLNHFRRRGLERRGFFCFLDHGRLRGICPIRACREILNDKEFDLETHLPFLMENQEPETTNGINMVCRVFGVERWSNENRRGLSDGEIIGLLLAFNVFMEDQKKSTGNGPKSSKSMDSGSSIGGPTPPPAADNSPLASGSISIDSTIGNPGGSCEGCTPEPIGSVAGS